MKPQNWTDSFQTNRLMRQGLALLDRFQWKPALAAFEKSAELAPESPFPYLWEGLTLADLAQDEAAVEKMRRAINLAPDNGVLKAFLGRMYLDQGNLDKAEEILLPLATDQSRLSLAE